MRSDTERDRSATHAAAACCALLLAYGVEGATAPPPVAAGVWYARDAVARSAVDEHEQRLTLSLRRITGMEALHFGVDGRLVLDAPAAPLSGSIKAREALVGAHRSPIAFLVEDHSGTKRVDFGQLDGGTVYEDVRTSERLEVRRVRLDFQDFERAQAPPAVRASFDAGFTLLHELLHGLGCADAPSGEPDAVGECELILNQARDELGLPRRERYFAEMLGSVGATTTARLPFRAPGPASQVAYLVFAVSARPGGASARGSVAGMRSPPKPTHDP